MFSLKQKIGCLRNKLSHHEANQIKIPDFFKEYAEEYKGAWGSAVLVQGMKLAEQYKTYDSLYQAYWGGEIEPLSRKEDVNLPNAFEVAEKYLNTKRISEMPSYFQAYVKDNCKHLEYARKGYRPEYEQNRLLNCLDDARKLGEKLYHLTKPQQSEHPFQEIERLQEIAINNNLLADFVKYSRYKDFAYEYSRNDLFAAAEIYMWCKSAAEKRKAAKDNSEISLEEIYSMRRMSRAANR